MTFSHTDAGTPESRWREAGVDRLPEVPGRAGLAPECLLVVVAAHPDDETLGATGLIRSVLAAGGTVTVVVASAGERSHPDSPTHTPQRLVGLRAAELDAAVDALGAGHRDRIGLVRLGLPDGALAAHTDRVTGAVEDLLDGHPGPALLAGHYRADGHADHDALGTALAALASRRGLPLYEFPIWYWHWADPERDQQWRDWGRWPLDEGDRDCRLAALAAHASQVRPLSPAPGDEAILGPGMLEHVIGRDFDVYRLTPAVTDLGGEAGSRRAPEVFDRLYREREDPWDYRGSWYERRKRLVTLGALPREHYGTVVECGSSIGVLTAALADRAGRVIGLEASGVAVTRAREALAGRAGVQVVQAVLPDQWPRGLLAGTPVDLVVLSEIGYFLSRDELRELLEECARSLALSGQLVLCHWRHPVEGWPLDGDRVHELVAADPRFRRLSRHEERDFTVEVYARAAAAEQVAVVVPARNEEELLPGSLAALARAADRWEEVNAQGSVQVVVALDHCTDASARLAAEVAARDPRFHVLDVGREPVELAPGLAVDPAPEPGDTGPQSATDPGASPARGQGVGRARDLGVRRAVALLPVGVPAGGEPASSAPPRTWVASTDADTEVPQDWLVAQAVLAAGQDGPVVLAGTVALAAGEADEAVERRWHEHYEHREGHGHVHGANLGLPWEAYARLGGFPHVAEHEDVALVEAARAAGMTVLATDRTRVMTSPRPEGRTPGGFAGFIRTLLRDDG